MKQLKTVNKYLWKYKWTLLLGLIFTACSNFLGSLAPEVVSQAIDFANHGEPFKIAGVLNSTSDIQAGVLRSSLMVLGLAFVSGFFLFLMRKTIIVTSHKIVADIREDLYAHYQTLDQFFYKKNSTGDLMSRLTEDIANVRMYVGPAMMYFTNMAFMFIFYVYRMLMADVKLTIWTLLPLPFLSLSIYIVNSIIFKKTNRIQTKLSGLTTYVQEAYSGIRVMKAFARESSFSKEFESKAIDYQKESLSLAKVEAFFFPLMLLLIGTSTIIAIYVGSIQMEKGLIETGTIVQFIIYVGKLTWPVTSLGWIASILQKAAASQQRINEFLLTESKISSPSQVQSLERKGAQSITFRDVSFQYPDTGIQALKNVSFQIEKGERVAIIGKTGSGKTTIADLILRIFDPTSGEILLNNQPIKSLELSEFRRQIGYVPQDVFLFSNTIQKNIQLVDKSQSIADVEKAAEIAVVAKDIQRFKDKYQTKIGERGVTLSGGQKQRVSIARAIINDPSFLILDDALSAVDAETEQEILTQFDQLFEGKTVIVITHRVFTLFDVDRIIVLDNGRVAQSGSHNDLIAQEGIYKELYELSKR